MRLLISALSSDLCLAYISAHRNRLRPFWCLQSFTDYTELCLPSNLKTSILISTSPVPKYERAGSVYGHAKDYLFTIALVGITLCTFGYSQFSSTFPQYMAQNPLIGNGTKLYGLMLTLNAIVVLATQFPIVHFAKRFSPLCSLMLGNVMVSISMAIFTVSHGVPSIVMIVITFTIGEVLLFSMMDLYVDQIANQD